MSMNHPILNTEAMHRLRAMAQWTENDYSQKAGEQGVKMEAALRLVLLFYTGDWTGEKRLEWHNLQVQAGVQFTRDATTKGLCDVIRDVLGEPALSR